jgi:transmembrane 9 superfamily member 2/4
VIFYFSVVFSLFFMLNLILWGEGSSAAVPFTTLIAILALWFGVSVPLTFVGAFLGFRKRVCTLAKLICADL